MAGAVAETKKRHRPRALVVIGILALVAALLVGGVLALQHYQPVIRGSTQLFPTGHEVPSNDPSDPRPTYVVSYVDGRTMTFGFSIRNGGRWGISVTGIGRRDSGGLLTHLVYHLASETFIRDLGPFHPFPLQPGKQQSILVTGTFGNCENYVADSGAVFDGILIEYKTLDIIHRTDVPLEDRIEVMSPPDASCPRPRAV